MTETVLSELLQLRAGLEVRLSLLRPDLHRFFLPDWERLNRLIEELQQPKGDGQ